MIKFITSLNENLFNSYGRRFIESWISNAKSDVKLKVYCEKGTSWFPVHMLSRNVEIDEIESDAFLFFRRIYGQFGEANGRLITRLNDNKNGCVVSYNYRLDAVRFCFKAFSYLKELDYLHPEHQFLIWIDADVVCKKPFGADELSPVLPRGNQVASFLGRTSFPPQAPHSECGFVAFNLASPHARSFISSFVGEYVTGTMFLRSEWHDSFIFDQVRQRFEAAGAQFLNISGAYAGEEHPFVLTELGKYFDHLKGPRRKIIGHS